MKKNQDIVITLPHLTMIYQKEPGRELDLHTHDEHEFFIPLQGEIKVHFSNQSFACGVGKLLYIPPHLEHSFTSSTSGQGERMIFLLSDKKWKKCTSKSFSPLTMPLNSLVRELAFYLLLNPQSKSTNTFVSALFESLIENLALHKDLRVDDFSHLEAKVTDERIKKALTMISFDEEISVAELARKCGLSNRNLNRLFLSEVGATPKNMMIMKKVNKARELLLTTKLTVTDISLEVGYNSLSKFISTFQKYTGQLPMEYRKSR